VVYTTFHHPDTQANVITTEYSDWATNCPEYKVTAVQISPSNGPSEWQKAYDEQARQQPAHCACRGSRGVVVRDPVRTVDRQVWRDGHTSEGKSARSRKRPRSRSPITAAPMP
jgi:hypothetical protein